MRAANDPDAPLEERDGMVLLRERASFPRLNGMSDGGIEK